jgi:hypothetical protein
MNDHVPTTTAAHASHDPALVAALAARQTGADVTDAERAAARELVASCGACADLLADLVALQVALPTMSTPARPRDFSLTPDDAERLRAGGWRRVLGFFGSARDSVTRPLAVGLTTLGLAGLLVATLPSIMGSGGATAALAPVGSEVQGGAAGAAPAAPSAAPLASAAASAPNEAVSTDRSTVAEAQPGATEFEQEGAFSGAEGSAAGRDVAGDSALLSIQDDASGLSVLFVVAGVMLIAGLGLFLLRWSARRLG